MVPTASDTNTLLFTFYVVAFLGMTTATAFFFLELARTLTKWRTIVSISGLITFAAAVHYYYMKDYYLQMGSTPTHLRYADWLITVPMLCLQFYLIVKKTGKDVPDSLVWKLLGGAYIMLVAGYIGEAVDRESSVMWGVISTFGYLYIVYMVWFGEVKTYAKTAPDRVQAAITGMGRFVLFGWLIYPIGYTLGTPGGFFGMPIETSFDMNYVYNIGDLVNKIGFGLVIWGLTRVED